MAFNPQEQGQILQQHADTRGNQLDAAFWTKVAEVVNSNKGSINTVDKKINFPTSSLHSKDDLWNKYLDLAQRQGVRPDYAKFAQTYQMFKTEDDNKLTNLINAAEALGLSKNNIKKSIEDSAKERLTQQMLSGDPDFQALYGDYLTPQKSFSDIWGDRWENLPKNIKEWYAENPDLGMALNIGGGLAAGYGGYRGINALRNRGATTPPVTTSVAKGYRGPTKSTLTKGYQKYLQDYEGPRKNRKSREVWEKEFKAKHKANSIAKKSKATVKKPTTSLSKRIITPASRIAKAASRRFLYPLMALDFIKDSFSGE